MELIKHFELYIAAQKATGVQFVVFGAVILLSAIALHFVQLNPIAQGLRNGFFGISFLLLASGTVFILSQNKLLDSGFQTYQSNEQVFKEKELERMQQLNKSVPRIILGLSIVFVLLTLALIFSVQQPLWRGVFFGVLIYLLGLLVLESISYLSVKTYLESLLNL